MKRTLFILSFGFLSGILFSFSDITLKSPDMNRAGSLMKALEARASASDYTTRPLELQDLSDLLWAANGVNRPSNGKRTAPSAMNARDIDVYVFTAEGAYLYLPKKQALQALAAGDFRGGIAGGQRNVAKAPLIILLVSDISRFPFGDEALKLQWGAMDAGIVSQNISLFCASASLSTRPRASMDVKKLREILKLKASQYPMLNHPVSYLK